VITFFRNIIHFVLVSVIGYIILLILWGEVVPRPLKKNLFNNIGGYGHTHARLKEIKTTSNIDVLFLGSSHTYRSFDTRIFDKHEIKSFNLGTNAQKAHQTNILLKRYLKKIKPKVVIYEVYPGNLSGDGVESTINIINNDNIDLNIVKLAFKQNNLKIYNALVFSVYYDVIQKKINYKQPKKSYDDVYINGGFVQKNIKYFKNISHKKSEWIIDRQQLKIFEENIKIIKENNIKLILVQAPITKNFYNSHSNNQYYDSIMNSLGNYYNFNKLMSVNDSLHFYDYHHLNQNGVNIFNEKMIKILGNQLR